MVRDADDVAGKSLVEQFAPLAQKADHRIRPQFLARAHHLQAHAAFKMSADDAQESDPVAMRGVHIGLDLEDHTGEFGLGRLDHPLHRGALGRCWRHLDQRIEDFLHAKVVDGRAEEHRRLATSKELFQIEGRRCVAYQFDLALGLVIFHAETFGISRVVDAAEDLVVATSLAFAGREDAHLLLAQIHHAVEMFAHADRPGEGHDGHAEFALDLVHQRQRILHFAVHLVDEGQDRRVACAADLQQATGLRFDAVGRVDHHQRRVDSGQHAVGVFGEILVSGGVEQIDHAVAVFHLHHARSHRDAALLFDFHPVRGRVARGFARLDRAGDLDRAREQQQLFSQRGLARVRVRNDGKSAAAQDFAFDLGRDALGQIGGRGGHGGFGREQAGATRSAGTTGDYRSRAVLAGSDFSARPRERSDLAVSCGRP